MGWGVRVDDEPLLVFFRQMAPRYAGMLTAFAKLLTHAAPPRHMCIPM